MSTYSLSIKERLLHPSCSSCQTLVRRVIVEGEKPAASAPSKAGIKVARGQATQVQHRQGIIQAWRTSHIGRQDLAREPMIRSSVVNTRSLKFDGARSQADRARLGFPISDDERVTILVTQVAQSLDVLSDFQFQCLRDHTSCPFAGQFVQ